MFNIAKTNFVCAMEKILKRSKKDYREVMRYVNVVDGVAYVSDGKIMLFAPVKKLSAAEAIADGSYNLAKAAGCYIMDKAETSATPPNYKQIAVKGDLVYKHKKYSSLHAESVFGILSLFDTCKGRFFASYGCDMIEIARPLVENDDFMAYRLGKNDFTGCYIEEENSECPWSLLVMPICVRRTVCPLECTPPDEAVEAKAEAKIEAKPAPVVIEKPKAPARSPFAL